MNEPRILMVLPEVPWPTTTGGKRAHAANLEELRSMTPNLTLSLANIDTGADSAQQFLNKHSDLKISIVETVSPVRLHSGVARLLVKLKALLSPYPPVFYYLRSSKGQAATAQLLKAGRFDAIWVDHLNAMALLPDKVSIPITLSMQNVESELLRDICRAAPLLSLRRFKRWLDWRKMMSLERRLLRRANQVVCLSDFDARKLRTEFGVERVTTLLPQLFEPQASWRPGYAKTLLFVGQATHAPNRESIEWIIEHLAPALMKLDPAVSITIVGAPQGLLEETRLASNLTLHGKLEASLLQNLFETCTALLCPVVLGSGIKIKILEAASNGVPVIATPESLQGLGLLTGCVVIKRADVESDARTICTALHDLPKLTEGADRNLAILTDEYSRRGHRMMEMISKHQPPAFDKAHAGNEGGSL